MKKYTVYENENEMDVETIFDTACRSCLKDLDEGFDPKAKKVVLEAIKNRKEIIRTIKGSECHRAGCETGRREVHCIAIVDGKAHCLKSLSLPESDTGDMYDQIQFVYEKKYNKYNYMDFQMDFYAGLDAVWVNFEYENVA